MRAHRSELRPPGAGAPLVVDTRGHELEKYRRRDSTPAPPGLTAPSGAGATTPQASSVWGIPSSEPALCRLAHQRTGAAFPWGIAIRARPGPMEPSGAGATMPSDKLATEPRPHPGPHPSRSEVPHCGARWAPGAFTRVPLGPMEPSGVGVTTGLAQSLPRPNLASAFGTRERTTTTQRATAFCG